jgi:hypothetical protein
MTTPGADPTDRGAMVGAGIFALLGAAGEVAGSAVWISFLMVGGPRSTQPWKEIDT